jgi:hypothetical protein
VSRLHQESDGNPSALLLKLFDQMGIHAEQNVRGSDCGEPVFGCVIHVEDLLAAAGKNSFDDDAWQIGAEACARLLLNQRYGWPISDVVRADRLRTIVTEHNVFVERPNGEHAVLRAEYRQGDDGDGDVLNVWDDSKPAKMRVLPTVADPVPGPPPFEPASVPEVERPTNLAASPPRIPALRDRPPPAF